MLDAELGRVDPSTVGVGIISWRLDEQPAFLDHVLDHRPRAVWLSFGDPTPYLAHIHDPGGVAVCQVLSLQEATSALQAGADVLVVQDSEAGGHGRAGRGLLSILPAVVDLAGRVPVVAAGGIATGRQLAACWTLGAAGVVLGTRLYATHEAADSDTAKQRLVALRGDDTVRTTVFDLIRGPRWPPGYTGGAAVNGSTRRWHGREAELEAVLQQERAHYQRAAEADDLDARVVWAGEGVDLIHEVPAAGDVVRSIHREARRHLNDLAPDAERWSPKISSG